MALLQVSKCVYLQSSNRKPDSYAGTRWTVLSRFTPTLGPCHSLVSPAVLVLFHDMFSVFRFITGPAELGDVPIPRTPPKMFVNTDSEQEELVLVVYKVRVIHFDVQCPL